MSFRREESGFRGESGDSAGFGLSPGRGKPRIAVMHPGITAKLFVAFLLTSIVSAVAVGFGVRTAFDHGFEKYIEERENTRRDRLAAEFATAYRDHGNWEFMRGEDRQWQQMNAVVRPVGPPFPFPRGGPSQRDRPPHEHKGPPPGSEQDVPGMPAQGEGHGPPRGARSPPGALLDARG